MSDKKNIYEDKDAAVKTIMKISVTSIVSNALLTLFKLVAGAIAHSGAMISDAVHSASDVFSTIIVMIGAKISSKDSDKEHPYGHERMECVAATLLATILFITGFGIGYSGVRTLISGDYKPLGKMGALALSAAVISIVVKEAMYWYTRAGAKKIDSSALMADAWHHRSDALSSVGALIGIGGSMLGVPLLDPLASVVICAFIIKAAYDIYAGAINKMIDHSCDSATEELIRSCILSQEGVICIDLLNTRVFGNRIYVEVEISANGELTLNESHEIAECVHSSIEKQIPKIKHVMVHVNPYCSK